MTRSAECSAAAEAMRAASVSAGVAGSDDSAVAIVPVGSLMARPTCFDPGSTARMRMPGRATVTATLRG